MTYENIEMTIKDALIVLFNKKSQGEEIKIAEVRNVMQRMLADKQATDDHVVLGLERVISLLPAHQHYEALELDEKYLVEEADDGKIILSTRGQFCINALIKSIEELPRSQQAGRAFETLAGFLDLLSREQCEKCMSLIIKFLPYHDKSDLYQLATDIINKFSPSEEEMITFSEEEMITLISMALEYQAHDTGGTEIGRASQLLKYFHRVEESDGGEDLQKRILEIALDAYLSVTSEDLENKEAGLLHQEIEETIKSHRIKKSYGELLSEAGGRLDDHMREIEIAHTKRWVDFIVG